MEDGGMEDGGSNPGRTPLPAHDAAARSHKRLNLCPWVAVTCVHAARRATKAGVRGQMGEPVSG
jgi:hypothetical protein